jgi:hypothetical protein
VRWILNGWELSEAEFARGGLAAVTIAFAASPNYRNALATFADIPASENFY